MNKINTSHKLAKNIINLLLGGGGALALSYAINPLAALGFFLLALYVRLKIGTEMFERFGENKTWN